MHDLQLVGFTTDRRGLIFRTTAGARPESYIVPLTDELVALVRSLGDAGAADPAADELAPAGASAGADPGAAPSRAQPRAESQLSVREIQARLRAGEDVARVALEAGVDPAWIERFAPPVRAEQRRVVERALASHLERPRAGASAVPLRRAVGMALADRGIAFTAAAFDAAWSSRLIGHDRWAVQFRYRHRGKERTAVWDFDAADGSLTTADRTASQLGFVAADGHHDRDAGTVIDGVIGDPDATPIGTTPAPRRRATAPRRSERAPGDDDPTTGAAPAPAKTASRKASRKRTAAKASSTKKAAARKPSTKKPSAKKAAARKASTKKPSAKKAAARKASTKKPSAKKASGQTPTATRARARTTSKTAGPARAAATRSTAKAGAPSATTTRAAAAAAPATAPAKRAATAPTTTSSGARATKPAPASPPTSPRRPATTDPHGAAPPGVDAAASNGATRSTRRPAPVPPTPERPAPNGARAGAGAADPRSAAQRPGGPAPAPAPAPPAPVARRRTVQVEARRGADGPAPRVAIDGGEPANPDELLRVRARRVEDRLSQDARAANGTPSGSAAGAHLAGAARTDPPAVPRPRTADAEPEADRTAARHARAAERNAHTVQFRSGAAAPVRIAGEASTSPGGERTPAGPPPAAPRPASPDRPQPLTPPVDANGAARPRTRRRRQLRAR